jgi:5-methylcytosine-specific restriction enzyme subunit McrC
MIRVQNIYQMLAYAFRILNEDSYTKIATEDFEYASDLLAAILAKGIANQIKRGLGREYIHKEDTLSIPVGKIAVSASFKQQTILKKKLICEFDEFTKNALVNKILKSTALLLIRCPDVTPDQKRALKKVMLYFADVDVIDPRTIKWASVKYHRNNATYKMLINICYFVIQGLLITEKDGSRKLRRYIDDQRMHSLFERFVHEYYRKHYPEFNPSAAHIDWDVDNGIIDFLPAMKSDITLEYGGKILIIDTKYYSHTMQINTQYDNRTLHSNNMYQIFTYVKNKDIAHTGMVGGVLLYAKTDEEITPDNNYLMSGNKIGVNTLDLNTEFKNIANKLNAILSEFFSWPVKVKDNTT